MKVVILLVLAALAVQYATAVRVRRTRVRNVRVFRTGRDQMTRQGSIRYIKKTVGEEVKMGCPGGYCEWYHDDNEIPEVYGDWRKTEEDQALWTPAAQMEQSGTYSAKIGQQNFINHLTVLPPTMTEETDDLFDTLEATSDEIVGVTYENKYLYNVNVNNKKFVNVNFVDVHFHRVDFSYSTFVNVRFTWTNKMPTRIEFSRCNFVNVTWDNAMIANSQFRNCKWTENADTKRAAFANSEIRNTVFCDNSWMNTKWENVEAYNTTFVRSWFNGHTWDNTNFLTYYVAEMDCAAIAPGMMVVNWKRTAEGCHAYVHMPRSAMATQCNYEDVSERKTCQFYPSVRFLDCTMKRVLHTACRFSGVEWHRTKFDRCVFTNVALEENYFMYCSWICNTWSSVTTAKFVKFMANDFRGDRMKFLTTQSLWFHSTRMFDVDMRWKVRSAAMHMEYCLGEKVTLGGKHTTLRLLQSTLNNIRFVRYVLDTLEYCGSYLMEWGLQDSKVKAVQDACDGAFLETYCDSTWSKGLVATKGDSCKGQDFFAWCKKEHNLHHPACVPFTRARDPSCCSTKGNANCGFEPTTAQWWKTTGMDCKNTPTTTGRMGDYGEMYPSNQLNQVPGCIKGYMYGVKGLTKGMSKGYIKGMSLWVRELTLDADSSLPSKLMKEVQPPRGLEKIEEHRVECNGMAKGGEERMACEQEILMKGQTYAQMDWERQDTKRLIVPFSEALEKHITCAK